MVMKVQKSDPRRKVSRGGMLPRLSKTEVRKCGLTSRATFWTTLLMRISIRKEQDRGRL